MKRPKTHTVTLYGAEGTGQTAAAAKAHAIRRIETAFAEPYAMAPVLTRFPEGRIGLVYRTLEGWCYDLMTPHTMQRTCYGCQTGLLSAHLADRHMRRHVAQLSVFTTDDHGLSLLQPEDSEGAQEHQRYVRFQHAYRQYATEGKSDTECHRLACEASAA
jgi:hypothetical protein